MATILSRVRETLLAEGPRIPDSIPSLLKKWQEDGSFSDLDYRTDSGKASGRSYAQHLERLLLIGKSVQGPSSSSDTQGAILREKGVRSFRFLSVDAPGTANIRPLFSYGSMHVPAILAECLVLWRTSLDPDLIRALHEKYFVAPGCWKGFTGPEFYGMNMTERGKAAFLMGLLLGDRELTEDATARVAREIVQFDRDGVCADGSFHQHDLNWAFAGEKNGPPGYHLYSGGYGIAYAVQVCQFLRWTRGTEWDLGEPCEKQLFHFVLNHLQWLSYPPHVWELTSLGRSLGAGYSSFGNGETLAHLAKDMLVLGKETDALKAVVDRFEKGVSEGNRLSGTRIYWNSDFAVSWSGRLFAALRMVSWRTARPETWLTENAKGFYLGDGFLTLALSGDEYGTNLKGQIFPLWDWERLPGVTAVHTGKVRPSQTGRADRGPSMGVRHFVGGVSDGTRGLCVMDFERPGTPVRGRKAVLFTGRSVACFGAGISLAEPADFPVETTVQQAFRRSPLVWRQAGGETVTLTNGPGEIPPNAAAFCSGFGFRFLGEGQRVVCEAGPRRGDWKEIGPAAGIATGDLFWIGIDHGQNPHDGKYAFEISACESLAELEGRPSDFKVIANDEDRLALSSDPMWAAVVFYRHGRVTLPGFGAVDSEDPILVLLSRKQEGTLSFTFADPTQLLKKATLYTSTKLSGPGATWDGKAGKTRLEIDLPQGLTGTSAAEVPSADVPAYSPRSLAGSSVTRVWKVESP